MTSVAPKNTGSQRPQRDPNTVGLMSLLLPGLGQLANGEQRKGLLFMIVGVINYITLVVLAFAPAIIGQIQAIGQQYNMKPNITLLESFAQLSFGSPASLLLALLFISFAVFSARDAHDKASHLKRQAIYHDYVLEMPEATSGSYIFHASFLLTCFLLAFFFLIPPPPRSQVTDIEFIQNEENTKEPPKTQKRAQHNSKAGGHHDPTKPSQQPTPAPKAPSKQAPEAKPQQHQAKPQAAPTPTPTPSPSPHPSPTPTPHPSPTPAPHPSPSPSPTPSHAPSPTPTPSTMPKIPNPFVAPSAAPNPHPSPAPSPVAMPHVGSPTLAPMPRAGVGAGSAQAPGPAPAPISVASASGASGGGGPPTPVPVGGGATSKGGGGGPAPAPAPTRAGRGGGGGGSAGGGSPGISVAPSVARSGGGGGGSGEQGNPDEGPGRPSVEARKDVDFGPYMADLQRRIKRAWFPPKGNESKRVKVVFKVHKDGQMTNLRILISAGLQIADAAALKAVENAAPFRPLPDGAPNDVDIEFTFDYNVFNGGGKGVFRQF